MEYIFQFDAKCMFPDKEDKMVCIDPTWIEEKLILEEKFNDEHQSRGNIPGNDGDNNVTKRKINYLVSHFDTCMYIISEVVVFHIGDLSCKLSG